MRCSVLTKFKRLLQNQLAYLLTNNFTSKNLFRFHTIISQIFHLANMLKYNSNKIEKRQMQVIHQNNNNKNVQQMQYRKKIHHYSYFMTDKIGQGQSSTVFIGENDYTKEKVAIKVIELKFIKDQNFKRFLNNQLECIRKINHPYLLKFVETYETSNNIYIITEYCEGGDLSKYYREKGRLNQKQLCEIFYQFYSGYVSLLQSGFIHRDIKPANILMQKGKIRIADFGIVKKVSQYPRDNMIVGTTVYMPPESINTQIYNEKTDVWSIGVMLYELIHGKLPWKTFNDVAILRSQINSMPIAYDQSLASPNLIKFIKLCLQRNPSKRISVREMMQQPWMKTVLQQHNNNKIKNANANIQNMNIINNINLNLRNQSYQKKTKNQPNTHTPTNTSSNTNTNQQLTQNITNKNPKQLKFNPNINFPYGNMNQPNKVDRYMNQNRSREQNRPRIVNQKQNNLNFREFKDVSLSPRPTHVQNRNMSPYQDIRYFDNKNINSPYKNIQDRRVNNPNINNYMNQNAIVNDNVAHLRPNKVPKSRNIANFGKYQQIRTNNLTPKGKIVSRDQSPAPTNPNPSGNKNPSNYYLMREKIKGKGQSQNNIMLSQQSNYMNDNQRIRYQVNVNSLNPQVLDNQAGLSQFSFTKPKQIYYYLTSRLYYIKYYYKIIKALRNTKAYTMPEQMKNILNAMIINHVIRSLEIYERIVRYRENIYGIQINIWKEFTESDYWAQFVKTVEKYVQKFKSRLESEINRIKSIQHELTYILQLNEPLQVHLKNFIKISSQIIKQSLKKNNQLNIQQKLQIIEIIKITDNIVSLYNIEQFISYNGWEYFISNYSIDQLINFDPQVDSQNYVQFWDNLYVKTCIILQEI